MDIKQAANEVAKSKLTAATGARQMLTPGEYDIDQTLHIKGTIKVGEDYDTAPTVSIPLKETLALFIAYSGITGDHAKAALVKAMQHSISLTGTGQGELAKTMPVVNQTLAEVENDIIAKLPRQPRKGAVTSKLTVTQLVSVTPNQL
jgi:hypothetical protein